MSHGDSAQRPAVAAGEEGHAALDRMLRAYTEAVEEWISAIRIEEALANTANRSVDEIDRWEKAHFDEEAARERAKAAKRNYESALRETFFGFS